VSVPTCTPEGMQLEGTLALCRSFLAAVNSRPGEVDGPLEYAAELAARTGEINAYGLGFGPQDDSQRGCASCSNRCWLGVRWTPTW
jgi:hypothetical protein